MRFRCFLGAGFALALVAACSSSDKVTVVTIAPDAGPPATGDGGVGTADGGGASVDAGRTGSIAVSAACQALANAACAYVSRCFGPTLISVALGNLAQCQLTYARDCGYADVSEGAQPYTEDAANACVAALASASCALDLSFPPALCARVGTRPIGATCKLSEQCQSGFCDGGDDCGHCATRGAENGACTGQFGDICAVGLACVGGVCKKPVAAGAACPSGDSNECPAPQRCVNNTCAAAVADGSPCTQPAGVQSDNGPCDASNFSYCAEGHCFGRKAVPSGGACDILSAQLCVGTDACASPQPSSSGTCTPKKSDGQSCLRDNDECLAPASCANGKCTIVPATACD